MEADTYKNTGGIHEQKDWQKVPIFDSKFIFAGGRNNKTWIFCFQSGTEPEIKASTSLQETARFYSTSNPAKNGDKIFLIDASWRMFIFDLNEENWRYKAENSWK